MAKSKKRALTILGATLIGAGAGVAHIPEAQAYQEAIQADGQSALEQFLREHPTSVLAADVLDRLISFGSQEEVRQTQKDSSVLLAARFKDRSDKGRPDIFGDPGVPAIGPPGLSGY